MPKRTATVPNEQPPAKRGKAVRASKSSSSASSTDGSSTVHFVMAHAAGHHPAGGKHAVMQRWSAAFEQLGPVHDALVFPKPFNLMPRLVAAQVDAINKSGAKVVLVGVGMGARVAVHLLSGTPGDDGKPLPAVPVATKAKVEAIIAIDYPLLRVGTREERSAPLLALPADAPPLLFVHAPKDKHADAAKLTTIAKRMKASAALLELDSGSSEKPSDADLERITQRVSELRS